MKITATVFNTIIFLVWYKVASYC